VNLLLWYNAWPEQHAPESWERRFIFLGRWLCCQAAPSARPRTARRPGPTVVLLRPLHALAFPWRPPTDPRRLLDGEAARRTRRARSARGGPGCGRSPLRCAPWAGVRRRGRQRSAST